MVAHPHCPCTRASLAELERIIARCRGAVTAHVLFLKPGRSPQDWEKTGLWRTAAAIPDVRPVADVDGAEAVHFGARTSGHVLLYDPSGRLLFSGGITGSRGHQGDNPGRVAVIALIAGGRADPARTVVFGCPLFEPRPRCDERAEGCSDRP
jgi:glyoxylase-like metal-dependent hydrolase (beta-lactamase superfamily II)